MDGKWSLYNRIGTLDDAIQISRLEYYTVALSLGGAVWSSIQFEVLWSCTTHAFRPPTSDTEAPHQAVHRDLLQT